MKNFELFQGKNKIKKSSSYFEGWYFKNFNGSHGISFIPGINISDNKKNAFIQILTDYNSYYIPYPFSEFKYGDYPFFVQIGNNRFSKKGIIIDINHSNILIQGELYYKNLDEINKSFWSPNIMGPFSYIPFMECNHSIISMKHNIWGNLTINNQILLFDNGLGYIEKDWGVSFPKSYLWCECNNFTKNNCSIFFSIADIPFKMFNFQGFICVLHLNNKEYRFATYNQSKVKKFIFIDNNSVNIEIVKGMYTLIITCKSTNGINLIAPVQGQMAKCIKETINSVMEITLKKSNDTIFSDIGNNAGLEIVKDGGNFK